MSQQVTLQGTPIQVADGLPAPGDTLADFVLTGADLKDVGRADYAGKRKLFNIFPSLDTPTCATSVQRFNNEIAQFGDVTLLQVSADLPFAQARFCSAKQLENGSTLSMMRDKAFARDYGVLIENGPMAGLCARAVIVADAQDLVLHTELVAEIADEPDYEQALAALRV